MAAAIAALYERDRAALGAEARRRVLAQHTWDQAFPRLLAAYASLDGSASEGIEAKPACAIGYGELPAVVRPAQEDDFIGSQVRVDRLGEGARLQTTATGGRGHRRRDTVPGAAMQAG